MYSGVESLAALVRSTPEALNLVAWLWSFEILNSTLSTQLIEMFPGGTQPSADGLLHHYLLVRRDFKEPSAAHSVFGNGPGAPRLATVALKHTLRTTLIVNQLGLNPFVLEQMRMSLRNLHALHSTHLHLHLLSQDSACVVTGALVALVSQPFDAASADITANCITEICEYLALYIAASGISCLNRSLELGLLLALMRAHPWLDHKQSTFDVFTALMSVHLPRYLIYLSVLRQVHKSFAAMQQVGMIGAVSNPCRKVWLAFEQYARVRLKLANDSELEVAPCDNHECNRPSSLRCSSCSNAVYCSKECQSKTWDSHSESCQSLINTRQSRHPNIICSVFSAPAEGIPPSLAQVDVQFALRVVQQDFEENKADICRRWTEAGTLPLTAGIDYSVFPHAVNIEPPRVVREQMRSDAVIFTVLPQGREGKEYYMCDLGLTRGADDTDEETVRVVVEMVGAQPVPAFFPIN
ncbi:hypothetical protein C8R46DRAFT_1092365 [Mycena filopes]|nr:hypothetical protein C8R46DRAFT_1092365 [Mycena filopes]